MVSMEKYIVCSIAKTLREADIQADKLRRRNIKYRVRGVDVIVARGVSDA